jgi:hypothetical protein
MIHLVTAVSRPENLPRIQRSIALSLRKSMLKAKWLLVVDDPSVQVPSGDGFDVEKLVYPGGPSKLGIAQKNFGMDHIQDGFYHCLDDDNIVHPDFFQGFARHWAVWPAKQAFVVCQKRWDGVGDLQAAPHRMIERAKIDNTMFVVSKSLIGSRRYDPKEAGYEDFYFFRNLYLAHPDEFVFVNEFLAYYNFIRTFPAESPVEQGYRP